MTQSTHTITFIPTITYEGVLQGAVHTEGLGWCYEGTVYDTEADEGTVLESVGEALSTPTEELVCDIKRTVFSRGDVTYTSQVVSAMALAYAEECEGGDGVDAVVKLLQETARRLAVIEALTI